MKEAPEPAPPPGQVTIYHNQYLLNAAGHAATDVNYLRCLAAFVDAKMRAIAAATTTVDSLKVAVLAALNIADQLHRAQQEAAQTEARLLAGSIQYAALLDSVLRPAPPAESSAADAPCRCQRH